MHWLMLCLLRSVVGTAEALHMPHLTLCEVGSAEKHTSHVYQSHDI